MKSRLRILPDGREICRGYQWEKRKRELRERAEGYCEAGAIMVDESTGVMFEPVLNGHGPHWIGEKGETHHVIKRSKQRDDRLKNLRWICHWAHIQIHGRVF